MSKLIMLSGLPAAGKSVRAKEIVEQGGWVRVNKDLIRKMLHFDKWTGRNEGLTNDAEKALASFFLKAGTNVVVDDTNLGEPHRQSWSALAKSAEASFTTEKITTDWRECISRDTAREGGVGRNVILGMAFQYGLYPKPEKPFVLCDLDGTLCDIKHRLHFVKPAVEIIKIYDDGGVDKKEIPLEKKDWKSFFEGIPGDTVKQDTLLKLREFQALGHEIVFISARPEIYRKATEEWLAKHYEGSYSILLMRPAHDKRPDTDVKSDMYKKYIQGKYGVEVVIDDRPSVIRMWRDLGLTVIDVGAGVEF